MALEPRVSDVRVGDYVFVEGSTEIARRVDHISDGPYGPFAHFRGGTLLAVRLSLCALAWRPGGGRGGEFADLLSPELREILAVRQWVADSITTDGEWSPETSDAPARRFLKFANAAAAKFTPTDAKK